MQDTSTQAMTEVALGLSMAFFCLLILALFSIGLPEQAKQLETQLHKPEQLTLVAGAKGQSKAPQPRAEQQFVFYFNGQFYDQVLQKRQIQSFTRSQPLILAVPDNLALAQVMAVRKSIKHPNLSITLLNQEWLDKLEQI
jgi:hypothetical protein